MAARPITARLDRARPYALGAFRIVVGLLFTCHGTRALFGVPGAEDTVAAGTWPTWYAAVIELVAGILVLVGLGTRAAAFIASGAMAYAYFTVHQPQGLFPIQNSGEGAAIYSWVFLLLVFTGPGAPALDNLFSRRDAKGAADPEEPAPVAA
ncbi:DoxX family protein [Streptomyces sp. ICN441]|nr:DoxX family protein [Streptomyces sp. PKU-MA01144]TFE37179.1 DoxX family protein [Streptomyces sp. ICN441]